MIIPASDDIVITESSKLFCRLPEVIKHMEVQGNKILAKTISGRIFEIDELGQFTEKKLPEPLDNT